MTYEEFLEFIPSNCMYETIYDDSNGHPILVIRVLDAYGMVNKAASAERRECEKIIWNADDWVGSDAKIWLVKSIQEARGQA